MKRIIGLLGVVGILVGALASTEDQIALPYLGCPLALNLHYVISEPTRGKPVGDVFFVHGLGDAAENHAALFRQWNESGFRVIAVDLPSHGRTSGASLNWATFSGLAKYFGEFLAQPKIRPDANRPLIVSGWSTGGLLVVRMVQKKAFHEVTPKVSGLVLFAPGISVKALPGEAGMITQRTLTRRTDLEPVMPIRPRSPYLVPAFAIRLKINSWLAQLGALPLDLPTLVLLADPVDDRYIHTEQTERWFEGQIRRGAQVWGYRFPGAYHDLDNELEEVALRARFSAELFTRSVITGETRRLMGTPAIRTIELPRPANAGG